ncbi:hypothetical protein JFA41_003845 [Salmonella enterica subsp. enterica serovar Poona]|nr:hypothetical protein [Salmonella enterica subsp. enterica serovar Poona]ELM0493076.1 hypothetical protein [Salmonella enterica]
MKFTLRHGLTVGTDIYKDVEIIPVTTFMIQDAKEAAERPVSTPEGYKLLVSDSRTAIEMTRRRIKYIGDIQGPISEKELRRLHDDDMQLINEKCMEMDIAQDLPTDPRTVAESAPA